MRNTFSVRTWLLYVCMLIPCLLPKLLAQSLPTSTVLEVSTAGDRHELILFTATVKAAGLPVTAGAVSFIVNGASAGTVQVRGDQSGPSLKLGTAALTLKLPNSGYVVSAIYAGTTKWARSTSTPTTVDLHLYAPDFSYLQKDGADTLGYAIHALEETATLGGTLSLMNASASTIVQQLKITPDLWKRNLRRTDTELAFQPAAFAVGDLSGRGLKDLVVADPETATLSVYFQKPLDGSEQVVGTIPVGAGVSALIIGDLNCDGVNDIVAINSGEDSLTVALQSATVPGNFETVFTFGTGSMPVAVALGDYNADGFPDLAVADFGDNSVSILLNDPSSPGQFASAVAIPTQAGPASIVAGDFSGNGTVDLAVAGFLDNTIAVIANTPNNPNLFKVPDRVFKTGLGPLSLSVEDMNRDGELDLVVANSLDSSVSILLAASGRPGVFPEQRVLKGYRQPVAVSLVRPVLDPSVTVIAVADAASGILSVSAMSSDGVVHDHEAVSLGPELRAVLPLYCTQPDIYGFVTLDPSLRSLHYLSADYLLAGQFSGVQAPTGSVPVSFQTLLAEQAQSKTGLPSNLVTLDSVPKRTQTIKFPAIASVMYGTAPLQITAEADSGLPVSLSVVRGPGVLTGSQLAVTGAGTIVVQADQSGSGDVAPAVPVQQVVWAQRAPLTIQPTGATRLYGQENPSFTGTITGLVNSDSVSAFFSSLADLTTAPGLYQSAPFGITATLDAGSHANDYQVALATGALRICPLTATQAVPSGCELLSKKASPETGAGNGPLNGTPPSVGGGGDPVSSTPPAPNQPSQAPSQPSGEPSGVAVLPIPPVADPGSPSTGTSITGSPVTSGGSGSSTTRPSFPLHPKGGPSLPVKDPSVVSKGGQASNGNGGNNQGGVGVLPIPIPLPIGGLPTLGSLLPHITLGGGNARVASPSKASPTQLLLLNDTSARHIDHWTAVSLMLTCDAIDAGVGPVVITAGATAVATFQVPFKHEFRARLHVPDGAAVEFQAHYMGDKHCSAADAPSLSLRATSKDMLSLEQTDFSKSLILPDAIADWQVSEQIPETALGYDLPLWGICDPDRSRYLSITDFDLHACASALKPVLQ